MRPHPERKEARKDFKLVTAVTKALLRAEPWMAESTLAHASGSIFKNVRLDGPG